MTLAWTDTATNEIGERIERSIGNNTGYALLVNVGPGITVYTDGNLLDGVQYDYRIQSFNTGGFSTYSNEQSAITILNSPTSLSRNSPVFISNKS